MKSILKFVSPHKIGARIINVTKIRVGDCLSMSRESTNYFEVLELVENSVRCKFHSKYSGTYHNQISLYSKRDFLGWNVIEYPGY